MCRIVVTGDRKNVCIGAPLSVAFSNCSVLDVEEQLHQLHGRLGRRQVHTAVCDHLAPRRLHQNGLASMMQLLRIFRIELNKAHGWQTNEASMKNLPLYDIKLEYFQKRNRGGGKFVSHTDVALFSYDQNAFWQHAFSSNEAIFKGDRSFFQRGKLNGNFVS